MTMSSLARYDHLLEQVNHGASEHSRIEKCAEECLELATALTRLKQGRDTRWHVAEEIADVLLTARSVMLELEIEFDVSWQLEAKALRLHGRLLKGEL